jgi:hypothetical protein
LRESRGLKPVDWWVLMSLSPGAKAQGYQPGPISEASASAKAKANANAKEEDPCGMTDRRASARANTGVLRFAPE